MAARRRRSPVPNSPTDYWTDALAKLGLLSPIISEVTQMTSQTAETTPKVEGELRIFAERLINTLCPPEKGYAPIIVNTVRGIYDVLEGRKELGEWFTQVRQALGLKSYQLASIIYQCLDGLRSREARELRDQWFNFMQAEMRGYGVM